MSQSTSAFLEATSLQASGKQISRPRFLQGISRIKPEMMQKVLSSITLSDEQRTGMMAKLPSDSLGGVKLMELFPERKSVNNGERDVKPPTPCNERPGRGSSEEKQTVSQLTIFYNGEVNVYNVPHDKAQEIMRFAGSNLLNEHANDEKIEQTSKSPLPSAGNGNLQNSKLSGGLAQVRKLSLQRFLQKRKDRLNSVAPFPTLKKETAAPASPSSDLDDLSLSLVLPSQQNCS